jgi:hypothetical protein
LNEDKQPKPTSRSGPGYLETVAIALMISAVTVFGYERYFAQKIYVLDLKGYLRNQKALLVAGEISEKEWQASLDSLEQDLDSAASNPAHIILLKDVVLRNGDEIKIK